MGRLDYNIVEGTSPAQLAEHVNVFIRAGWVPIGGVAVTPVPASLQKSQPPGWIYTQAIIKDTESPAQRKSSRSRRAYQMITQVNADDWHRLQKSPRFQAVMEAMKTPDARGYVDLSQANRLDDFGMDENAQCAECGGRLEIVRPGKYQCPTCEARGPEPTEGAQL